jgi:anti-sigma factor RsiW
LLGGRLDYLGGRAVAALAYQRGKHPINLFIWPERDGGAALDTSRDGYNVIHWTAGGMTLWAVSDVERDELVAFERDWKAAP